MAQLRRLAYPVNLQVMPDTVLVSFPDIPEALTEGTTEREALLEAADCLVAALGGYVNDGRSIPQPSASNGPVVELPALIAAKIALYETMREQNIDIRELAERLGAVATTVRRLLDLDHRSPIDQVETALEALGKRPVSGRLRSPLLHASIVE